MITLYIAMSLDGYIADKKGGVAWLEGDGSDKEAEGSYESFLHGIDTILMGKSTYTQITTQLSPHTWPYPNQHTYVITHSPTPPLPKIDFIQDLSTLLPTLKDKSVWICGGANLAHQLLELGCINELHISIIPTLLGRGIPLFQSLQSQKRLKLLGTESYNGITDLRYSFQS